MRALSAIVKTAVIAATVIVGAAVGGAGEANAADMAIGRTSYVAHYPAVAVRAPQVFVYDDEPGVYVRDYAARPWAGRHYYPFTGKRPKVGRYERMSAVRPVPRRAQTFYRAWSTNDLYPPPPVHSRYAPNPGQ